MGVPMEGYTEQYTDVDIVVLAEQDHFNPQNTDMKRSAIDAIEPEYVLLEENSEYTFEELLERDTHELWGQEKVGRATFFDYLDQRMEEDYLEDVVLCDKLPDGVTVVSYVGLLEEGRAKVDAYRETHMSEKITEYTEKSEQPVVAVLGADHTVDDSTLRSNLDEQGLDYVIEELPEQYDESYNEAGTVA